MPKPTDRTSYDGHTVDWLTRTALEEASRRLGYADGVVTLSQGSFSTGVAASGGTHDGGGVVDLSAYDAARKVVVLRELGFAAWHRIPSQGPWPEHVHAVLIGDTLLSPAARAQVTDYLAGRNGLASHAPDDGPRGHVDARWTWVDPDTVTIRIGVAALQHTDPPPKIAADVRAIVRSGNPVTLITEAIQLRGIENTIRAAAAIAGGTYVPGGRGDTGFILGPAVQPVATTSIAVHPGQPGPGRLGGYSERDVDVVTVLVPSGGHGTAAAVTKVTVVGVHPVTGWARRLIRRKLVRGVLATAAQVGADAAKGGNVAFIAGDFNIDFRSKRRGPLRVLTGWTDCWADRGGAAPTHGARTYDAVLRYDADRRVGRGTVTLTRGNSDHKRVTVAYPLKAAR